MPPDNSAGHAFRAILKPGLTLAALAITGLSCSDGPTTPGGAAVTSVIASRDSVVIDAQDSLELRMEPRRADGTVVRDVTVAWESLHPAIAHVSGSGMLTGRAPGRATIVARAGRRSDTVHVTVIPPIIETSLSADVDTVRSLGDMIPITISSRSAGGERVGEYSIFSRDYQVAAQVIEPGALTFLVRGNNPGSTYIVVRERRGTVDSVRIVVAQRPDTLEMVAALTGTRDREARINAKVFDARGHQIVGAPVRWTSADNSIATVDSTGLVRFHELGSTTITAIAVGAEEVRATTLVTVTTWPGIRFRNDFIHVGSLHRVEELFVDLNGTPLSGALTLTSSDSTIAAVRSEIQQHWGAKFAVAGKRAGTALIIASAEGLRPDTLTVYVNAARVAVRSRFLDPIDEDEVLLGATAYYTAIFVDSAGGGIRDGWAPLTLTSSDTTVIRLATNPILSTGSGMEAKAVGEGTAIIRGTSPGYASDSVIIRVGGRPRIQFMDAGAHTVGAGLSTGTPYRIGTSTGWQREGDLTITLTSTRGGIVDFPSTISMASNYIWQTFNYAGRTTGTDTVIASAPGFDPDTAIVIVTTPRIAPMADITVTAAGFFMLPVELTDSLGRQNRAVGSLAFRLASSDPSIVRVDSTFSRSGQYWWINPNYEALRAGSAVVTIVDAAGAMAPVSGRITVRANESLRIRTQGDGPPVGIGTRQRFSSNEFVLLRDPERTITVHLRSSDSDVLRVPDSVVVGHFGSYVQVVGGSKPGTATIQVSSPGYTDFTSDPIQVGRAKLGLTAPESVYVRGTGYSAVVRSYDHLGKLRTPDEDVPFLLESIDGGVSVGASGLTIPAGAHTSAAAGFTVSAPGTLRFEVRDPREGTFRYESDTVVMHAVLPPLTFGGRKVHTVGIGQVLPTDILRPANVVQGAAEVTISRTGTHTSSLPSVIMGDGRQGALYSIRGRTIGVDTLIATADGYQGVPTLIRVTEGFIRIPDVYTRLHVGDSIAFGFETGSYDGSIRPVAEATTFQLWTDGGLVVTDGSRVITSVTIPAGRSYAPYFYVKAVRAGSSELSITNLDYRTQKVPFTIEER